MRVVTIGTFDYIHEGHRNLLRFCRDLAPVCVIVGVNADTSPALNGKPLFHTTLDRAAGMTVEVWNLTMVARTRVVVNAGRGAQLLREGDLVVVGSDWRERDYAAQLGTTWEWLDMQQIAVVFKPRTPDISSTQLREARGD